MPEPKEFSFNRSFYLDNSTAAVDALSLVGKSEAEVSLDSAFNEFTHTTKKDSIRDPGKGKESFNLSEFLGDIKVEDVDIDKLAPALGIGGLWGGSKLLGLKSASMPEGLGPRAAARTKKYGVKGTAFTLAYRAAEWGREKAADELGLKPIASTVAGTAAGVTAYKALPALARLVASEVKLGMAHQAVPILIDKASKEAFRHAAVGLGSKYRTLSTFSQKLKHPKLPLIGGRELQAHIAEKAGREALEKELAGELAERMGPKRAKSWLDIGKRLMKPNIASDVGRALAKIAPKTAAKLAASATATAFPEPVSTIAGLAGLIWTAWDVMKLIQYYPDLKRMIFEDSEEAAPSSSEDKIISGFIEEDRDIFYTRPEPQS